ncbi:MAG: type IV toxin-antitoxin system AbiEi family antitoxin domain-containing protein [Acidimicrobiia bacterium]|nr:type IV toxin-antitoxin system AbiEi family antitoxin domain-containing protein [Acidimicrobiia bacterium]
MTSADRRIAAIATGQLGWVSRQQAHAAGLSDRQLRSRVQSGFLEQSGANTFRSPFVRHSPVGDLRGLLLDIGEPCWASGPTAAALHGFDGFALRPPFHVSVLRDRAVTRTGHVIHRTTELPLIDRATVNGIPTTRGARTLIDLARTTDNNRLTTALDSGLRDGLFSEASLHERIVALRTSGRYGIPALLEVIQGCEITRGAHSWLEREFLRLVTTAGLPRPQCQEVLAARRDRLVRVDCRFAGTNIVVELLGYRFHRSPADLRRDTERASVLAIEGYTVLQFTYEHVVADPAWVLRCLGEAFAVCGRHNDA